MGLINYLRLYGDNLAPVLHPDERPLAMELFQYHPGHEDLGAPRPRFDLQEAADMALGLPTERTLGIAERLVSGMSLVGWPGSKAQLLSTASRFGSDLVVTNQRLLTGTVNNTTVTIDWELWREEVASLSWAPRFAQTGRLRLVLTDGSAIALVCGYIFPGAAKRIVAAWH
ncbi:MAG: hypothetical protein L0G99_02145 [Propionibacteriales bacterium]|nr:hypothetical protein [Propionibacteriales bacterium]